MCPFTKYFNLNTVHTYYIVQLIQMHGGSSADTHLADTLAENTWTVVGPWVIPGEKFGKMRKCKN